MLAAPSAPGWGQANLMGGVEHRRSNPLRHTLYAVRATYIRGLVLLRLMDQSEETPTLPERHYRRKPPRPAGHPKW